MFVHTCNITCKKKRKSDMWNTIFKMQFRSTHTCMLGPLKCSTVCLFFWRNCIVNWASRNSCNTGVIYTVNYIQRFPVVRQYTVIYICFVMTRPDARVYLNDGFPKCMECKNENLICFCKSTARVLFALVNERNRHSSFFFKIKIFSSN